MRLRYHILHAMDSVRRHRVRSFLCGLGVSISVIVFIVIMGITEGGKAKIIRQIENLGINNIIINYTGPKSPANTEGIDYQTIAGGIQSLSNIASVSFLKRHHEEPGVFPEGIRPVMIQTDHVFFEVYGIRASSGRSFAPSDSLLEKKVCVIGQKVAHRLGENGAIGALIPISGDPHQIIGILNAEHRPSERSRSLGAFDLNEVVITPISTQWVLVGETRVDRITISLHKGRLSARLGDHLKTWLERSGHLQSPFQIIIPREIIAESQKAQRTLHALMLTIGVFTLLVGGIGVANIMYINILERRREIGIRRALGAQRVDLLLQFLIESLFLSVSGSAIGILGGMIGLLLLGTGTETEVKVALFPILFAAGMAILIGTIAGIFPAHRAYNLDPTEALRS